MSDDFNTISQNSFSLEVKKSKFIANSFNVFDELSAKEIIKNIKKEYHSAKHHVYAYSLKNGILRSSDDGEPRGTAGIQLLCVMNKFNLKDTLIIVIRYFGGILLGKGGLARAYYSCAESLVLNSKITKNYIKKKIRIKVSYDEYYKIINSKIFYIENSFFNDKVVIEISINADSENEFRGKLNSTLNREVDYLLE